MTRGEVVAVVNAARRDGRQADLTRANLRGANLSGADLRWANLRWADLTRADLRWANLSGANLGWANLSGADLRWANLSGADLSGANLSGANLSGAIRHAGVVIEKVLLVGMVARYWTLLYGATDGEVYLEYGCETAKRTVADWRRDLPALCECHEPERRLSYERTLRGLLAIDWRLVDGEVQP